MFYSFTQADNAKDNKINISSLIQISRE